MSNRYSSQDMSKPPGFSKLLLLLGAISILAPFSLDMYLPALPAIADDLKASAGAVQLTLPAFFAGLAVSQLLFGTLADRLGRRPPLLCGLALSVIGAVGCALSGSVHALTVWRTIQALGVGSASVIPRAVIRDRFDVAHTARALSLLGLITGFGPILAPQVGGAMLLVAGWRTQFWLLAGLGVACTGIAYVMLRESIPAHRSSVTGPKLWFHLLTDRRYVRYALAANLIQSSVFAYIAGASFVYIDHFKLSPQAFAWMFGVNALGLMVAGRINAHIVGRLGPELIFRRAMLITAALGVVLLGIAAAGLGGFWAWRFRKGCSLQCSASISPTALPLRSRISATPPERRPRCSAHCSSCLRAWPVPRSASLYDGTPHAMAGVMCAVSLAAVVFYRSVK